MSKATLEERLKRQVVSERSAAGEQRVRFSKGLRAEVVKLVGQRGSQEQVAQALGLGRTTIHTWVATARTKSQKVEPAKLERVVVRDATVTVSSKLELVFPSGARVLGLGIEQLAELLRKAG